MNMELFYKKVYTVAFRLTGDEKNAEDMAVSAIIKISKQLKEDFTATENVFQLTIIELIKVKDRNLLLSGAIIKDRNLLLSGAIIAIFCYGGQPNIYPRATLAYIICHGHSLDSLFETTK